MKKICSRCEVEKDLEIGFGKDSGSKDGHRAYCKICGKEYWASYSKENRSRLNELARKRASEDRQKMRIAERKSRMKQKYGLSIEQLDTLRKDQNNQCLLCLEVFNPGWGKSGPSVDHCHKSGKVRGLLCHLCNTALGKFKDNQEVLTRAIVYLQKNS